MQTVNKQKAEVNPASAADFLPEDKLRELQLDRLEKIVLRSYERTVLYKKRMNGKGIHPGDLKSLDDIRHLPFTVKNDLRDTYPFGLFASPMSEIVRLHASSGTTGKPIVVAYTQEDLDVWTDSMVRTFAACGLHSGDIIQNAYGYGLFTGGLGAHYGAEKLGATVIPISGGNTDRQLMIMQDFGTTAFCSTPSYFTFMIERAAEMKIDIRKLHLRTGIFGAEPWTEEMRNHIEKASGIKAYDIYGLSEITGPGVGSECEKQDGLHIFEDYFYPEIIDPVTEKALPDGTEGELVLTTLCKQAMPMIRYRTRDITMIMPGKCKCGRNIRRIRKINRRSDDMLIIRGVNIFPSQIESAILAVEGILPHYQIVLTKEKGLDNIEVQVEITEKVFSDKVGAMEELQSKLVQALENVTSIRIGVRLVAHQTIKRSEGKAKRVIDLRNKN
ncbi:MAG TPA: phenylacetate--CoA ligase [Lentisphaeria bacterium]|nr:MAG: phenylacetate--CoA ligase [Lentisphaerae bacterium GWF2_49_21]HBC85348.1 phenylacetate--CoA ligase [Lentisphaeria bacterium]